MITTMINNIKEYSGLYPQTKSDKKLNDIPDVPIPKPLVVGLTTFGGALWGHVYASEWDEIFKKAGKWGALVGGIAGFVLSTLALRDTTPKTSNKLNKLA